ncbi:MAG: O-antigen translocase [Opitutaceae bacterium]|nr:O-antigen translocase [Opitutaceae bacterium]
MSDSTDDTQAAMPHVESHGPGAKGADSMSASPDERMSALRSTSIIGGASGAVLLVRIVRTKVLAHLLGPAGIGLEAIFDSIISITRTLFSCGINSSGVRQIATAVQSGDMARVALTVLTLRRVSLVIALASAAALILARDPISRLAFGNSEHSTAIGALSIVLLCGAITGGQGALLQGMRRLGDIARLNVYGAVIGAVVSIPIVYVWGQNGIAGYMIVGAVISAVVSWHFARRIQPAATNPPLRTITHEASQMIKLGMAFVASALLSTGVIFALRAFVVRELGMVAAGQLQAATALSMVYVGFILQAMGTDFYPRLTAASEDHTRANRLVNEQTEISLILAVPGILATITLAPWIIRAFYSAEFAPASTILVWQAAGMMLRVITWPMGYIIIAQGRGALFVATEVAAAVIYLVLAWLGLRYFHLPGIGLAFTGLYIIYGLMVAGIVRRISGFRWSGDNTRTILATVIVAALGIATRLTLPEPFATVVGCVLTGLAALVCLRRLGGIFGFERLQRLAQRTRLPFAPEFARWICAR